MIHITPALIADALKFVPPTLPRGDWARVGMAIKSEFADDAGFDLFDQWSARDADGYDAAAVRSTWRSVKAGGGVGIGTLLHLAQQHGFELPKPDATAPASTPAQLAQQERERAERRRQEQANRDAAHTRAASQAQAMWEEANDTGASPYLARKGVQPYGVRFGVDGWLLVPLRDGAGRLWNVQLIAPEKPQDGAPEKRFLKGGRKSGLWHWCASPETPPAGGSDALAVLCVAEGYATAASVHEATGHPVAVAFDAGNLANVAKALRGLYPGALIVLCGDDDAATAARTGSNPGRDKATAAARAVKGLTVFPAPLPEGASDFNDLRQHAGLDAVRVCVAGAIEAHQASHAAPTAAAGGAGGHDDGPRKPRDRFHVDDDGVWHVGVDKDGNEAAPEWVCSRLDVQALTRDAEGAGWGYLLSFADPLGHGKQWAMPSRLLSGDGGEYRATLLHMGLRIGPSSRARNLLTMYLQTRAPEHYATCTDRVGWHGRAFVLPRETVGDDPADPIVFQTDVQVENTFTSKGTPEQWRQHVGALCAGNSRLVFAVACAFAGPLLRPAGMESGGFHLRGDSSSGKTTALKVAASVYGGAKYLQRWRTTDNALEAIAAQHSDCLLILDELAQVDPKMAGESAYMLANEQSKARATRTAAARPRLTWRLLFLSAGELGLADHMAEGMKRARTGQEVRMADVPADAGAGMGAFESLHNHEGGAAFARHITHRAASVYGATGRAWLQWLTDHADTLKARIREAAGALAGQLVPEGASGQVERVGARFALVGAAGELATAAGLTGWPEGESERAARACFNAWLAQRGGIGNGEVFAMLRQVRRFLEAHGEGRFTQWHRAADDHSPKTLQRAGFRRMLNADGEPIKSNSQHGTEFGDRMPAALGEGVSFEYFILPEAFRAEVCQGFDPKAVCHVLLEHDCLVSTPGHHTVKTRLPGLGNSRCYHVTPAIFELDL